MAIATRIESFDRDIAFIVAEELSPEAQSAALAGFAREAIAEAEASNAATFGQTPTYDLIVDGRRNGALESVRPDGVVVAEFELLMDLFTWVGAQLVIASPRKTGRYAQSHAFFVDGREVQLSRSVPAGADYAFVNVQPYSRKIERGLSSQAPDGVYQAVASMAARRFGNIARAYFDYRAVAGGGRESRSPAIIIRLGR